QAQVILRLALVEIAQGKDNRAVAMLRDAKGLLDASDYGLALALAGRANEAISILEPAARQSNDPTVRQNLALAQALAGNWQEARIIAGQDVPANQLDARMQQWMQIAKPKYAADQVAAVVGVSPAAIDPGQPVQLALDKSDIPEAHTPSTAPVEVAAVHAPAPALVALSRPAVAASAPAKPSFVAAVAPVSETAPLPVAAVTPVSQVKPTLATLTASAVAVAIADAKAVLASITPHAMPAKRPIPHVARPATVTDASKSHAVVQLGAYASPDRVLAAWNGESRKFGALKAYAPMSARFASPKGTFYRLSVRGFNSIGQAKALCTSLRHSGGACFVRYVAGDAPVNIAMR
ncbi:MAG TPA: SPOR domain-containing protein, partial [Sphingomicrobium sp.]|nr:SPOR domain-containing protein [Sphingomicrobium sp.]